jgi:hypothetical protein
MSKVYIDFLTRCLPDGTFPEKCNPISFTSLDTKENTIKIQYGSFIIEFPINLDIASISLYDWSQGYILHFD